MTTFADSSSVSTITATTLNMSARRSDSSIAESDSGSDSDINEDPEEAYIQFYDIGDGSVQDGDDEDDGSDAPAPLLGVDNDSPITELISQIAWDFQKVEDTDIL